MDVTGSRTNGFLFADLLPILEPMGLDLEYAKGEGPVIRTNYFDLAMIMDYWSDRALNHHTEATSMLYAARECACGGDLGDLGAQT
jgi:uroporphyrinogen-III decarboxylase